MGDNLDTILITDKKLVSQNYIGQILHVDKTGLLRFGHIMIRMWLQEVM